MWSEHGGQAISADVRHAANGIQLPQQQTQLGYHTLHWTAWVKTCATNFNASFTIPSKTLPKKTHIFFFFHMRQMIELENVFGISLIPQTNIPTKTTKVSFRP